MPQLSTVTLIGASKREYLFNVYPIGEECSDEGGIYAFTKRNSSNGEYFHKVIYIEIAKSFKERLYAHPKQAQILNAGANCICLMAVPGVEDRKFIEKDLLGAYDISLDHLK